MTHDTLGLMPPFRGPTAALRDDSISTRRPLAYRRSMTDADDSLDSTPRSVNISRGASSTILLGFRLARPKMDVA